jgi:hypothetical protein
MATPPTALSANDNGTIAPTATGGSVAFAPEYCRRTCVSYSRAGNIWTAYGFRDAGIAAGQWPDELNRSGPIVIAW